MATNSRLRIPVNLPEGSTYDLLLVDTPAGYPEGKLDFRLMDTPRKITGIQKVAQFFLKILMTTKGSNVLNPFQGTSFPELAVNANRTGSDHDVYADLVASVKDAEGQCRSSLNLATANVADQLRSANVLGIDGNQETLVMYIQLVTEAGQLAQVAVPFPELDLPLAQG